MLHQIQKQLPVLLLTTALLSAQIPFNQKSQAKSTKSQFNSTTSAVVHIINGYQGKANWAMNGKTYELYALAAGSGYFVHRNLPQRRRIKLGSR